MEIVLLGLAIGAFALGFKLGASHGLDDTLKDQTAIVDHHFRSIDDPFRKTYGIPGLYLADINPQLGGTSLVIIQTSDFMDFIARKHAPIDADTRELKRIKDRLSDDYLLNKGMSPDTLAALKTLTTS